MSNEILLAKISDLPYPVKDELLDYLDYLIQKHFKNKVKTHPKAGCMKGTFIMSSDFNSPLTSFKDYMP